MKILITGGAGFIGSAVARLAISRGHEVVVLDALTYSGNLKNLAAIADHSTYAFVHADICNGLAVKAAFDLHQPDSVMHLAAESHVDRSIDGPLQFVRTNLNGTAELLEASRSYVARRSDILDKFRFHHVSTDEVFGALGPEGQFDETTPYAPNSPYSASKAGSDMLVRAWHETFGLPVVITNCSNNYGPYQHPEKLIPVIIINALAGKPIPVYGGGVNVRDWLHVDDHAAALLLVLEKGETGETYCIGGDAERRNLDVVKSVCAALDRRHPGARPYAEQITFVADRPGHDFRYAIDNSKIRNDLGWQPTFQFDDGIEQTVAWYLDNQSWLDDIRAAGFTGARLGVIAQ